MTMTEDNTELKDGKVLAITGPVVDVEFPKGALPEINTYVERKLAGAVVFPRAVR